MFTRPVTVNKPLSRVERLAEHRKIAQEIIAQTSNRDERLRLWHDRTGLTDSTFYLRKAEVEAKG
jgi:hypothetical protein